MSIAAGARLGPYEILAPLGAGGMGEVYRALDPRLDRQVAIKVLAERLAEDPDALARFSREAKAVAALSHPNIVALHDFGTHEGIAYAVTELLEGHTLRDRLRSGPLPLRRAIEWGGVIAQGLAAAHGKGLVHRDLKPENVFITGDGRVKILDFGLAKQIPLPALASDLTDQAETATATSPGVALGTVGYMSPEQVRGLPADQRSDIFAFGAVLYEMLTGQRAFRGASPIETLTATLKEEPRDPAEMVADLPPTLGRIVGRCLEKAPAERFQSAQDLAFALDAMVVTSGARGALPATGPVSRWRARRSIVALAAACAMVAAAYWLGRVQGERQADRPVPTFRQLTFGEGLVRYARFGPDAQTVFFTAVPRGAKDTELFSTSLSTGETRSLGPALAIVGVHSAEVEVLRGRPTSLVRIPLSGGAARELLQDVVQADASSDGKAFAVVRRQGHISRLEFPVGHKLHERTAPMWSPRISRGGDQVAFVDRPLVDDTRASIAVVDLAGKVRTLSREWNEVIGLAWAPGGEELWFGAGPTGHAHGVYGVSLTGKERLLLNIPGVVALLDVDDNGRALIFSRRYQVRAHFTDGSKNSGRDLTWLDGTVPADLSADGETLLFTEDAEGGGPGYTAFLRRTDGSPAMKLGGGAALALSPDGRQALVQVLGASKHLALIPTGPGEPVDLPQGAIADVHFATWFPEGNRILIAGNEAGRPPRLFVQDIPGGVPRPAAPEGTQLFPGVHTVSPDGRFVVALDEQFVQALYPLEGGPPQPIRGLQADEKALRWTPDGKAILAWCNRRSPSSYEEICRVDPRTGRREHLTELVPADAEADLTDVVVASNGRSLVYRSTRTSSDLYLVEGLRPGGSGDRDPARVPPSPRPPH